MMFANVLHCRRNQLQTALYLLLIYTLYKSLNRKGADIDPILKKKIEYWISYTYFCEGKDSILKGIIIHI